MTPPPEPGNTCKVWRTSRWHRIGPWRSCTTGAWTAPGASPHEAQGRGRFTGILRGGGKVDTVDIRLGAFVQHPFNARLGGTRTPYTFTYALKTIAPKHAETLVVPGAYPLGSVSPKTRYMAKEQAEKIFRTLRYHMRSRH